MIPTLLLNIHRPHDKVAQILGRINGTFFYRGLWFTNTSFLATSDPENVHYILSSNSSVYLKGPEWLKQFDIFGEALFNSDGRHGNVTEKLSMLSSITHKSGNHFQRHAFDIGCIMGMGFNPGVLSIEFPENRFHKATNAAMEAAFCSYVMPDCLWKLQSWLQIGKEKKRSDAWKAFDDPLTQCISIQRHKSNKTMASSNEDNDFSFLNCYLTGNYRLTREEIKRHLPMKQVEGGLHIPSNYDELSKLTYLHAALCETLRLYPPVSFEFRSCTKPDFLPSGHRVDRSTRDLIGIHAMGRMESLWGEDCYELKPERWISEEGKIKRESPSKFCAFLAGPRICPGKEVSFLVMKTTAAAIMHNYNVDVLEGQNIRPKNSVLCQMKKGLMVGHGDIIKRSLSWSKYYVRLPNIKSSTTHVLGGKYNQIDGWLQLNTDGLIKVASRLTAAGESWEMIERSGFWASIL
ncbi:hypothetical protein Goklo_007708, partial [Gossypium klotzschianum]|nr:hypothetical protein [Gossypium klotzschianum]